MNSGGKVVCVTGASGFVATWLVKVLLQRGYTVRASVRDPSNPRKTDHLRKLDGAEESLQLFKADLLEEGSFDEIVDGCDCVFHTASPFVNDSDPVDPQAELIDPAVKGTLNVLASCKKSSSVRKVIITSSLAAVVLDGKPKPPNFTIDETFFSDPQFCEQIKLWYVLSKTLAEQAAWIFSKENDINIITINPGMVVGPLLQPTLNTSSAAILKLIDGTPAFPNVTIAWVDVRDVVMAHVLAFESPSANGRYCLAETVVHYSDMVKIIHELYPQLKVADKCVDDNPFPPYYQVSKEKAKALGVEFRPLKTSIKDTIESLREKGFVTF
ncbi:Cinnamoyl-CoA reductase 1 [Rhynchospora pubera]|uniref:Cinnamoyl-CoA reductase 1 n=1 Tax=Rhynchospora pubera TaxID=906938 RepID=A0AAV8DJV5_9POAL|nr:Cinnamoyl-CoA reductase 1 [Rhynchospora pubera]